MTATMICLPRLPARRSWSAKALRVGIAADRSHCRHGEHASQMGIACLGQPRRRNGPARTNLTRAQSSKRRQRLRIAKLGDTWNLPKNRDGEALADARDRRQQFAPFSQRRVVIDDRADLRVNVVDLAVQESNRCLKRFSNVGRPRSTEPIRLLATAALS